MANEFQPKIIIDPFSLLVVNSKGDLKRIYCPFLARCMISINNLFQEETYVIDMVKTETNKEITFIIQGKSYPHRYFNILL